MKKLYLYSITKHWKVNKKKLKRTSILVLGGRRITHGL